MADFRLKLATLNNGDEAMVGMVSMLVLAKALLA